MRGLHRLQAGIKPKADKVVAKEAKKRAKELHKKEKEMKKELQRKREEAIKRRQKEVEEEEAAERAAAGGGGGGGTPRPEALDPQMCLQLNPSPKSWNVMSPKPKLPARRAVLTLS